MSKEEFLQLMTDADIYFGDQAYLEKSFHFAIMTYADEIDSAEHTKMAYIEFLEAFARIVDRP
jgi:hypothetical protein